MANSNLERVEDFYLNNRLKLKNDILMRIPSDDIEEFNIYYYEDLDSCLDQIIDFAIAKYAGHSYFGKTTYEKVLSQTLYELGVILRNMRNRYEKELSCWIDYDISLFDPNEKIELDDLKQTIFSILADMDEVEAYIVKLKYGLIPIEDNSLDSIIKSVKEEYGISLSEKNVYAILDRADRFIRRPYNKFKLNCDLQ